MIGIVVALEKEANSLLDKFENVNRFIICEKICYEGVVFGKHVLLIISGIGKVNASLSTQLLIDKYSPEYILNFGTCGGMNNSVEILKYYVVEQALQFDFDLRELDGVPLGYIQDYDRVFFPCDTKNLDFLPKSKLASADRFTNNINDINAINQSGASLRDMEGGAIAQVCLSNNTPLVMIKGITDIFGAGTAEEQFYQNLAAVGNGFPKIIEKVITSFSK